MLLIFLLKNTTDCEYSLEPLVTSIHNQIKKYHTQNGFEAKIRKKKNRYTCNSVYPCFTNINFMGMLS